MATPDLSAYVSVIETRVHSHYRDDLISIGVITELFGMAGGKLAYMLDGDAGLMLQFEKLEFLAPVYDGDYVRATARLTAVGRSSRRRSYEAHVVARTVGVGPKPTSGEVLKEPILVARATGITVTPLDCQRITPPHLKGTATVST
ncbi:MAG: hotdog fold domain-containing protein [Alphaproteobacteria bacterium]